MAYTWDDNGNLLSDGASTYTYDSANRLTGVVQGSNTYAFAYNGLGDRLRQTVNGTPTTYTLDLAAGLTQVLSDGTSSYLYGLGRVGEQQAGGWRYHLGDALGSVRQLADASGSLMMAQSYEPYGEALASTGSGATAYGFTGEWADATGLVHLRARYYAPWEGRFISRDEWEGDAARPLSYNGWLYAYADPVNLTDPSGRSVKLPCMFGVDPRTGACYDPLGLPPGLAATFMVPALGTGDALKAGVCVAAGVLAFVATRPAQQIRTWQQVLGLPEQEPKPAPLGPDMLPLPQPTATSEPDLIYRRGKDKPKTLSLHRLQDWETGLSFFDSIPGPEYIKFRVSVLRGAGYVVRPDGGQPVYKLWGGGPVMDPQTGQQAVFPMGHVTVYSGNRQFWDQWYQADLANSGTPRISSQLEAFHNLREP